jgi:hypothetical protein
MWHVWGEKKASKVSMEKSKGNILLGITSVYLRIILKYILKK